MNAYIVAEWRTEARLMTRLLPPDIEQHTTIVAAGGRATSAARTLLVTRRKPIAVLVNSGTVIESSVLDQRRDVEDLVRAVSAGIPFKVIMMVPDVKSLLFIAPAAVERVTGQPLSVDQKLLSRYDPGLVLRQLNLNTDAAIEQIVDGLTADELNQLRESPPIRELIEFLSRMAITPPQPITA